MPNKLKILSVILIFMGLLTTLSYFNTKEILEVVELKEIEKKQETNDYYALLEIPKIGLLKELYNDENNNVNKNVYVHYASTFPDELKSNVILAAHSGYAANAYFKDLYLLSIGDIIYLYYQKQIYEYEIVNIDYQVKNGTLYLIENNEKMLTLITCTKNTKNTQTIYYSTLKSVKFV